MSDTVETPARGDGLPTIYGNADIANALGVTRAVVSNWLVRYPGAIPKPSYTSPDGRVFWNGAGLKKWLKWHADRQKKPAA